MKQAFQNQDRRNLCSHLSRYFEMMSLQSLLIVVAVISSVFLGALSNWIYDLLKNRGVFPDKPTIKAVIIIALASLPFISLAILPNIPNEDRNSFVQLLEIPVPIWQMALISIAMFAIGYLLRRKHTERLRNQLESTEKELRGVKEELKTAERRLDQCLKSSRQKESIVRPK